MFQARRSRAIANTLALLLVATVAVPARGMDPTPASGSFSPTGSLAQARTDHTATLLPDGRVLVIGGDDGGTVATAEVWSPDTESFSPAGSLAQARKWHTASPLPDGRVLVIGGLGDNAGNQEDFLASAEIWDPGTETFGATGSMADARIHHTATLLPDGRVLAVAGVVVSIASLALAELWDPATGAWTPTGSLEQWRFDHTATPLDDGRVLVIGGGSFTIDGFETFDSAELWDPASGSFSHTGSLAEPRLDHSATRLTDGRVLVIAGSMMSASGAHSSAEVWDPRTEAFAPAGSLADGRSRHTATLLPDGGVLVIGGGAFTSESSDIHASAERWDPATRSFAPEGSLADARSDHTATLLPDDRVLVIGGGGEDGAYLASAEIYELEGLRAIE